MPYRQYTAAEKIAYYKRKARMAPRVPRAPRTVVSGRGDYALRKVWSRPLQKKQYSKFPARPRGCPPNKYSKYLTAAEKGIRFASNMVPSISGRGDYEVKKNSILFNVDAVPEFSNSERCTVISHREFISDIKSSTSFNLNSFRINPTVVDTFPWLSSIAQNYEQYVVQGMVFEYKTTSATAIGSTNTALGTVVMATQYNSLSTLFDNKQQMENYEFSQSTVPSQSILHAIECDPSQTQCGGILNMWNPNDDSDGDLRLYDLGRFSIATVGMQTANVPIGELWVSYKVCLLKPRLTGVTDAADIYNLDASSIVTGQPLGTIGNATPKSYNSGISTLTGVASVQIDASYSGLLQVVYAVTYDGDVSAIQLPGITIVAGSSISNVTNTFTQTGFQSVNGLGGVGGNALFCVHYLKCNGGYNVSTGAAPSFALSSFSISGDVPLTATLSIISMPDNMMGAL